MQFVVTLIWAFIQPSLWALAGGRLASELVRMVGSYFIWFRIFVRASR